jgi:hypothetical protein
MIKYYQLTPEILLEYVCENEPKLNEDGVKGNVKDLYDTPTILLKSNAFGTKYLCFKNESEGLDSISNLVLPLNNSESQFVVAKSKYQNFYSPFNISNMFVSKSAKGHLYEEADFNMINESCDVKYDKCIVHFTSKNYFGNYDSLIFQAYVYMNNKAKLYFASFLFKRTSNLELKAEHMLYNEKLYTTQIEFDIPNIFAIVAKDNEQKTFNDALQQQNIELLENTPIGINIFGVSSSIKGDDNYLRLNTRKINSISIPYLYNKLDEIHVNIREADDGDYYYIDPEMGSGYSSFVDYIESMGEDIRAYMVMHELSLREVWVDPNGVTHSEVTHKECHIISINEYDEDEEISRAFNKTIKYRPICIRGGVNYCATIIDTIKVINTVDSSSYEATGSIVIANPHKYGKRLVQLGVNNGARPIVNVYNKKPVATKGSGTANNSDTAIVLSKSGGFVVENKTQNISSFIECTNIGVSILEISPEDIE